MGRVGRRKQFDAGTPVALNEDDIVFLSSTGIDIQKVRTVAQLREANWIATRRQFKASQAKRAEAQKVAQVRVREWGLGSLVRGPRWLGMVYVVLFSHGMVGVRRSPSRGRIRYVNAELFVLIKKPTKKIVALIEKSVKSRESRRKKRILKGGP